jgi:hypothetical protein
MTAQSVKSLVMKYMIDSWQEFAFINAEENLYVTLTKTEACLILNQITFI